MTDIDRAMSGKTLKSATGWWGDPGVQMFQSGYILGKELSVSADGSGNDEVQFSFSGVGQFPEKVTNPTWPAAVDGDDRR